MSNGSVPAVLVLATLNQAGSSRVFFFLGFLASDLAAWSLAALSLLPLTGVCFLSPVFLSLFFSFFPPFPLFSPFSLFSFFFPDAAFFSGKASMVPRQLSLPHRQ